MDHAQDELGEQFKTARYIGLTSRNWQTRYREHQRDALTGSELLFHTTLASVFPEGGISQVGMGVFEVVRRGLCLTSELEYVNLTYEEAMQVEEKLVERTLHPAGLNMIPGGFSGIKLLHKLGFLSRGRQLSKNVISRQRNTCTNCRANGIHRLGYQTDGKRTNTTNK